MFCFHHPYQFYPEYNLSLQALFWFHSFIFILHIFFQSFKKAPPSHLLSGAIPWGGTNTELSLEVVSFQTSLLDQCQPQWHLQDSDEAEKAFLLYGYLQEKKKGPNQLFLVWCIWSWLIWVSVKILMTFFRFAKIQVPDPALADLWWHQHGYISCFNPWKIREKRFFHSVSRFAL